MVSAVVKLRNLSHEVILKTTPHTAIADGYNPWPPLVQASDGNFYRRLMLVALPRVTPVTDYCAPRSRCCIIVP